MPQTQTPPTVPEIDTAAQLRTVIGRLSRQLRSTASARQAGLTPTGSSLLLTVVRTGPVRLSDLGASEGINPTMLSRSVAALVESGLLERISDAADRRAAWVKATAAGRRLAERMRRERTAAVDAAMEQLTPRERRQIEAALPALEALAEELKDRRP